MSTFVHGGPKRYQHQRRGLRKLIETKGVCALLFEPGTGKTATTLDYISLLALKGKDVRGEARVLVIAPSAALDTWVLQAPIFMSPSVNFWVEALGGSIREQSRALAARGGNGYVRIPLPRKEKLSSPRALYHSKALAWDARGIASAAEGPERMPGPRAVICVVSFDTFSSRTQVGSRTMADVMLDAIKRFEPHLIVVDESHKLKSPTSHRSRLISRAGNHSTRRVMLTGTIMPQGPMDVFAQWRFLKPEVFGTSFNEYRTRYGVTGGYMGKQVVGYKNLDELQDLMALNAVVATKAEALDLPPVTPVIVPVHLSAAETTAYNDMKDSLGIQLSGGQLSTVPNALTKIMRLRQITAGHLPDDSGVLHDLGSSKAKTIASLVHDKLIGEKRIVVFCVFRYEVEKITALLQKPGTDVLTISGGVPKEDRMAFRARFGSKEPTRIVMVAQVKTMSLAVNELVTASHAIFGSLSQERDDLIQAIDRLNRIGQEKPVTIWFVEAPKTIDGVIHKSHNNRTNLERAALAHIRGEDDE